MLKTFEPSTDPVMSMSHALLAIPLFAFLSSSLDPSLSPPLGPLLSHSPGLPNSHQESESKPPFREPSKILHVFEAQEEHDEFGWVAGGTGDVNNDGYEDILVGAPQHNRSNSQSKPRGGYIEVYSGKGGERLYRREGKPGDRMGYGVSGVGDINGDGHSDFMSGAPQSGAQAKGYAKVWCGKTGEVLWHREGEKAGDGFGSEVGGVGDWDDDGYEDFLVGAPGWDGRQENSGKVTLFSGKDGQELLSVHGSKKNGAFGRAADGSRLLEEHFLVVGSPQGGDQSKGAIAVFLGEELDEHFSAQAEPTQGKSFGGMFVSILGDIDADGCPDVYATDWSYGNREGMAQIFSGEDGHLIREHLGKPGECLGIGKASCGDLNGDGHDDYVIGAWTNSDAAAQAGKATLYSGKTGLALDTWTSQIAGEAFGFDAIGIGDLNGDNRGELVITAAYNSSKGLHSGRVYVLCPEISED